MQSAWRLESRKYSPIVTPAYGAMYWSGAGVLEDLDHLRDGRALLPDRHVEAAHVLALLVDDRVHADRGLARAAVADDQLALAAPDRDHRVDGLEPGLERFLHRAAVHDARGVTLDRPKLVGADRALGVHRLAERVDDPTGQRLADRHLGDPVRPPDDVAFLDERVVAEQHRADLFLLEVEDHPDDVAGELEQLARHRPLEPVDARDAVADLDDAADLLQVHLRLVARELLPDDLADLSGLDHRYPRRGAAPPFRTSPPRVARAKPALERGLVMREPLAQPRQLAVQASVHQEAADFGDEPAQERAIHGLFEHHLLAAEHAAQPARQRHALAVGEHDGRAHASAHAAGGGVHELTVRSSDARQVLGAAPRGDERQEVAQERPTLEPCRDLGRRVALDRRGDPGAAEDGAERGLVGEEGRRGVEPAADRVRLRELLREREQRLRVGAVDTRRHGHLVADLRDRLGEEAPVILVPQALPDELLGHRGGELRDLA